MRAVFHRSSNVSTRAILYVVFIAGAFLMLAPLTWLLYSSFKPHADIIKDVFALPKQVSFRNFIDAWTLGNLGVYLLNSIFYSIVAATITVYLAMSVSYAFHAFTYVISKVCYSFFILGQLITVHAVLIPLFIMETSIGIADTRLGVILPYIAFGMPFMVYLGASFVRGLPKSLMEAARMDGAGHFAILHRIIIPVSRPIVSTMFVFSFLGNWNEFVFVFVLTSKISLRSLPVGINSFAGGMARDFGLLVATLVIGIVPILLFYILCYRSIVASVSLGALKG